MQPKLIWKKCYATETITVLRSRHFFGRLRLRLQVAKVPEPTPAPAPTYLGRLRLRLQAKKGGSRRLRLRLRLEKIFHSALINFVVGVVLKVET